MVLRPGSIDPTKLAVGVVKPGALPLDTATLTSSATKSKLLEAVRYAHTMWRLQAKFRDVRIMAVSAIGTPGCLDGPELEPLIKSAPGVATEQGAMAGLRDAVAHGVSACFRAWQTAVTVPGLPWYPMFAAFPGPMAPPMPNVPTPLMACVSAQAGMIMNALQLKQAIVSALPAGIKAPAVETGVGAMAQSLAIYFTTWLPSQQVTMVMGQGPVPSFAPPYVPVGTVVNGSILSIPGHLSSGGQPPMIVM